MSPMIRLTIDDEARFPRVSGDEPYPRNLGCVGIQFSPREWG